MNFEEDLLQTNISSTRELLLKLEKETADMQLIYRRKNGERIDLAETIRANHHEMKLLRKQLKKLEDKLYDHPS